MGRDIRHGFGSALTMVDSLWQESLVEFMGFLPADDCRHVLPQTLQRSIGPTTHQVWDSDRYCSLHQMFHQRFRVYHNYAGHDAGAVRLLCYSRQVERSPMCEVDAVAGLGSGVAIFLSLIMLCFQIGAAKDGFMDGVAHVIWSFGKRTVCKCRRLSASICRQLERGYAKRGHYLHERYFLRSQQLSI